MCGGGGGGYDTQGPLAPETFLILCRRGVFEADWD